MTKKLPAICFPRPRSGEHCPPFVSTALDYADTVRLPSLSLALARAHHACVSCRHIMRVCHAGALCVCVARMRVCALCAHVRVRREKIYPDKTAPALRAFTGRQHVPRKPQKASPAVNGFYLSNNRISVLQNGEFRFSLMHEISDKRQPCKRD